MALEESGPEMDSVLVRFDPEIRKHTRLGLEGCRMTDAILLTSPVLSSDCYSLAIRLQNLLPGNMTGSLLHLRHLL
jgi:hypothetical protein